MHTAPSICLLPGCGKSVDVVDEGSRRDSVSSQTSGTSTLVGEFTRNIGIGSRISSQDRDVDMDGNEETEHRVEESSTVLPQKRVNEPTSVNTSSNKKVKKPVNRDDSPILKRLIKELGTPTLSQNSSDGTITLQTFPKMNINSVNFHELNDMIIKAEDNNQETSQDLIRSYYYFGKGYILWFSFYNKTYSEDSSNSLVNDKIREHIPNQDKITETSIRKRKERAIKVFRLFNGINGNVQSAESSIHEMIGRVKSFSALSISKLSKDDIDYVIVKVLKANQ